MRKRWLLMAGVVLAAFVAVLAVRAYLGPGRWIDREHYNRIWKGMTQAEIEALLGAPPGHYNRATTSYQSRDLTPEEPAQARRAYWVGDDGYIRVTFDPQAGTVVAKQFMEPVPPSSVAEWVHGWLRRLWP
jgi:hypothetical protein